MVCEKIQKKKNGKIIFRYIAYLIFYLKSLQYTINNGAPAQIRTAA